MKRSIVIAAALATAAIPVSAVSAQDEGAYVSLGGGLTRTRNSSNSGALTSDFMTGLGNNVAADTVLSAGTELSWNTDFQTDFNFGGAFGYKYSSGFRVEAEFNFGRGDVDSHSDFNLGGIKGDEDSNIFNRGSTTLTGESIAEGLHQADGNMRSLALMGNLYYDIYTGSRLTPYLGAGLGYQKTKVKFNPSGLGIANDTDGGLTYQFIAGASYELSDKAALYMDYRYRQTNDTRIELDLLGAEMDIENTQSAFNLGVRFSF